VFNIKGNKYRLIVSIDYEAQLIYYKYFLTHTEYVNGKRNITLAQAKNLPKFFKLSPGLFNLFDSIELKPKPKPKPKNYT
jgi:hypothetical protein